MAIILKDSLYFVYAHINRVTNKAYIGVTVQTKANYRWGKDGKHYRPQLKFWNAIVKYGWDSFDHIILQESVPGEEIDSVEQYYIQKYDSYRNGYNATPGGKHQYYYQKSCKEIIQYDLLDNHIINRFNSIADGARWLELNNLVTGAHKRVQMSISEICNHKYENRKSYAGFGWCFADSYIDLPEYHTNRGDKRVLQYDLCGNFIKEWLSCSQAEKTLQINNIGLVCNGKRKKAGGFVWKFKE